MPANTDDYNNSLMIKTEKEIVKSPLIWNKVVKTIQNSNIDVDKLIKDSIAYGLDVGILQHNSDGKVVPLEVIISSNVTSVCQAPTARKFKSVKSPRSPNVALKSSSRSEFESFSCSSTAHSSSIQTRRSTNERDRKRQSQLTRSVIRVKRRKKEKVKSYLTKISKDGSPEFAREKVRPMVKPVPICAYCLGDELLNKRTKVQEDLITCWDCGTCAHPSCLRWPISLLEKVRTIRWQCLQCKCCSYCGNVSKKDDDMLLCDVCDRGFHMYCFNPPIKALPKGDWICRICRPLFHRREVTIPQKDPYFYLNCQIITADIVTKVPSPKKLPKSASVKSSGTRKYLIQSRTKMIKSNAKTSLLHLKKKKLLDKAVQRQRTALTDGLSMFFTPSNKRQSRVSKQSLVSNSTNDSIESKSPTSNTKKRNSIRSAVSRTNSKSPIIAEKEMHQLSKAELVEETKIEEIKSEISIRHENSADESPTDNSHSIESCSDKMKRQNIVSKSNESHPNVNKEKFRKCVRKPKKRVTIDLNTDSVADTSTPESSIMTISKVEQSTSQSVMSTDNTETDPYPISDLDRLWYSEVQQKVAELLPPPMDAPPELHSLNKTSRHRTEHSEPPELSIEGVTASDHIDNHTNSTGDTSGNPSQRFPPRIQIGKYVIDTWYSAPYPSEYARLNILYVCEYCLKHIKSYDIYAMHMEKCTQHFPPGNEIYRHGDISVFEVDGYISKLYCQQLCLLAKLFLDHKTLYYDVEPFLFYVAVISKNHSCHIIGYFSKEKRSTHKYNLSCIMVLPPYQKFNYGRFLIDFSYLLSRNEGQSGSPEKPLSTLGRLSYESYWKSKVIPYLLNREDVTGGFYRHVRFSKPPKGLSITIDKISTETGINPHDIASTIQMLSKTVDLDESDRITIQLDWDRIRSESEKFSTKYNKWVPIDADSLKWAPIMSATEKIQNCPKQSEEVSNQISRSIPKEIKKSTRPIKKKKILKFPIKKVTKLSKELKTDSESDLRSIISDKKLLTKLDKESPEKSKEREIVNSSSRRRSHRKYKSEIRKRTLRARIKRPHHGLTNDLRMVTRNKSIIKKSTNSGPVKEIAPIKVDLTCSDYSDNQSNEDCVVILSPPPVRKTDWRKSKPVLEMLKESMSAAHDPECCSSRPSPPINLDEPSPVSEGHHAIVCPTLVSPDGDPEEEVEADLILNRGRRPLIILEKCDLSTLACSKPEHEVIDLSDDTTTDGDSQDQGTLAEGSNTPLVELGGREMSVVVSDSDESRAGPCTLVVGDFVTPSSVRPLAGAEEGAPLLSRVPSQDSTLGQHDDSCHSLQLPSDISMNDDFKRFFNDGHVFNSITTSHTDSSDKDADESLLSVSNSDLEMNGTFFCDSSICGTAKYALGPATLGPEALRCSPGQSDLSQGQVSSTTPFVTPDIVWHMSSKELQSVAGEEVRLTTALVTESLPCLAQLCAGVLVLGPSDLLELSTTLALDKDLVSSSLGSPGVCTQDESVSSMDQRPPLLDQLVSAASSKMP